MQTGWVKDGSNWFYLDTNTGIMAHDTTIGCYTLGSNGAWVISTAPTGKVNRTINGSGGDLTGKQGTGGPGNKEADESLHRASSGSTGTVGADGRPTTSRGNATGTQGTGGADNKSADESLHRASSGSTGTANANGRPNRSGNLIGTLRSGGEDNVEAMESMHRALNPK